MFDPNGLVTGFPAYLNGSGAAFSPDSLATLNYWWDTADFTTSGSSLTGWTDRVSSLALTVNGAPTVGTSPAGGAILNTDALDDSLTATTVNYQGSELVHIFLVAGNITNVGDFFDRFFEFDGMLCYSGFSPTWNGILNVNAHSTGAATTTFSTTGIGVSGLYIWELKADWNSGAGTIDLDASQTNLVSRTDYDEAQMGSSSQLSLGGQASNRFLTADYGDVLIFDDILTGADYTNVYNYLNSKFIS